MRDRPPASLEAVATRSPDGERARDLALLAVEGARSVGGGISLLVGSTRGLARRLIGVALGPPVTAHRFSPAALTFYSTSKGAQVAQPATTHPAVDQQVGRG